MKLIFTSAFSIVFAINALAGPVIVPKSVKSSLNLYFKDVEMLKWEKLENGPLVADFFQNGKEFNVYFTTKGELKRIDIAIEWKELPVAARKQIGEKFSNSTLLKLMQNQDAESEAPFIVELVHKHVVYKIFYNHKGEELYSKTMN